MRNLHGRSRLLILPLVVCVVGAVGVTTLGGAGTTSAQPTHGELVGSPAELLGKLKNTNIQIQNASRASFFDVFTELSASAGIGTGCDRLLKEASAKGYRRANRALPTTCAQLRNSSFQRDSFFDVFISDPMTNQSTRLKAASLETDTNLAHGSRAFFDIWLDPQAPDASIVQLTLTNNWSDQPEVVKSNVGRLTQNGETRFFVDIARSTAAAGTQIGAVTWYRYWWYDSHSHYWWWYGGYTWWWYRYAWYGGGWWWWWNAWWPWWHSYHYWFWSNWWSDLNLIDKAGRQTNQ